MTICQYMHELIKHCISNYPPLKFHQLLSGLLALAPWFVIAIFHHCPLHAWSMYCCKHAQKSRRILSVEGLKAKETKKCLHRDDDDLVQFCQLLGRIRTLLCGAGSWGRLGRYINCPHLSCNFRWRFFASLAFKKGQYETISALNIHKAVVQCLASTLLWQAMEWEGFTHAM
jgi:hypothetical protein